MLQPLDLIDIESFLTAETDHWCADQLSEIGFNLENIHQVQSETPFLEVYKKMVVRVEKHMQTGNEPSLALVQPPTGSFAEYAKLHQRAMDILQAGQPVPGAEEGVDEDIQDDIEGILDDAGIGQEEEG